MAGDGSQSSICCEGTPDTELRIFNSPGLRRKCEMKSSSITVALFCAQFAYGADLAGPITKLISVPDPVPRSVKDHPPGPSPQFPAENTSAFRPRIAAPRVPLTQSLSRPNMSEKGSDSGSVQKVGHWDDSGRLVRLPGQTARDLLIQVFAPRLTMPDPAASPLTLSQI